MLTASPVAQAAEELSLPIIKAARLDDAVTAEITALEVDLGVIVAYGGLVREPLLSAPRAGWINLHFSLLPAWRGAAPVQRALIAGDAVLGASVFQLVAELDAGDVFATRAVDVLETATAGEALEALASEGAGLTADVVSSIADGTALAVPQEGQPTFAAKLTLADGLLDWNQPLDAVFARFRGVTPEPGAHTTSRGSASQGARSGSGAGCRNARSRASPGHQDRPPHRHGHHTTRRHAGPARRQGRDERGRLVAWSARRRRTGGRSMSDEGRSRRSTPSNGRPRGARGATDGRRGGQQGPVRTVQPARRVAYDVLRAVSETDAYANLVLPTAIAEARLTPRMRLSPPS